MIEKNRIKEEKQIRENKNNEGDFIRENRIFRKADKQFIIKMLNSAINTPHPMV